MRSVLLLSFASTVLSHSLFDTRHNSAKARRIQERAVDALDLNADAVFPPQQIEKRGLLGGLVSNVGSIVTDLLPSATTTTTTSTTASSNAPGNSPATTTTNPESASPSTTAANPGASPTTSAAPAVGSTNAPASNGNSNGGGNGSSGTSNAGVTGTGTNSLVDYHANPTGQVVTDEFGNTLTITGPVTRTWVTTLPNGVVSTVTEVLTPTVEVPGSGPSPMEPKTIAAIVGTIVTILLVSLSVALVYLMIRRKLKRRIALLDSRPTSIASFGSASDEFAAERRLTNAPVGPNLPTASPPVLVNGVNITLPSPPVPAANPRPISDGSDLTFDFSQYHKSRASIIEDRNRFRKIGQYPDADSYTPFVLPPSEPGHSEEAAVTPRVSILVDQYSSASQSAHEGSRNTDDLTSENPFIDLVARPHANQIPVYGSSLLPNGAARRSTLFRSSTFGSDSKVPGARRLSRVPSTSTVSSSSTEYVTALDQIEIGHGDLNVPPGNHPSDSTDHSSYHTALEVYAQGTSPQTSENPFADQPLPTGSQVVSPGPTYPTLRPNTAASSTMSSIVDGNRQLGATPDPSELFYTNSPDRAQGFTGRFSEESRIFGDGGSTSRQNIAYPALHNAPRENTS